MINSEMLKQRAKELGIHQKDIADALGLKQSSVALKLNNKRPMTVDEAEVIANLLSISDDMFASYFFSGRVVRCNIQLSHKEVRGVDEKQIRACRESCEGKADRELAAEIIDMLRPYQMTIFDIRRILRLADQQLEYVVVRK